MNHIRHKTALALLWLAHKVDPLWISRIASVKGNTITLSNGMGAFKTGDAVIIKTGDQSKWDKFFNNKYLGI